MCGRFTEAFDSQQFRTLTKFQAPPGWVPRYNVCPGTLIPVLRLNEESRLELVELRWGLIPGWSSDASSSRALINARAESLEEKPSFSASFTRRRCLVPADGFYEWMHGGSSAARPPVYFRFTRPIAMAAIWDSWAGPQGETIESTAIITTDANTMVGHVHSRMPALLDASARARWMSPSATKNDLKILLRPAPEDFLQPYSVSAAVNNPRNDSRALIQEAAEEVEAFATVYR